MTLTQLAEKHNLDPVAFRLALQEWIDGNEVVGYEVEELTPIGLQKHNDPVMKYLSYSQRGRPVPLIARPSLLEE